VSTSAAAALVAATCPAVAGQSADPGPDAGNLIERTHALLDSLRTAALGPFLADWPLAKELRPVVASALPVLRWLPEAKADAPALTVELVTIFVVPHPGWPGARPTQRQKVGREFLENYGWMRSWASAAHSRANGSRAASCSLDPRPITPTSARSGRSLHSVGRYRACGSRVTATGGSANQERLFHHSSDEPHAMQTGARALLALYLWRSANLHQKSHFDR